MTVEYNILGPLEVRRDGEVVPLPSGRARVLLATLLLRAGQAVTVDELVDRLWDGAPPNPARAKATLQMVVSRLRQALGEVDCVRTSTEGYTAAVPPESVDLHRFRSLVAEKRFATALSLWRGRPLSNVGSDSLHRDEVAGLLDERVEALEQRIEADLAAGAGSGLVVELRALTREHPLRERFWAQLMLALYRSDQQAEALAVYATVRELLSAELGVDPGHRLRELHESILNGDPALAAVPPPKADLHPVPRQLPARTPHFVGRGAELAELTAMLDAAEAGSGGGAAVISAIKGVGGIGKTTLAVQWVNQVVDRFPDGQLYVNLRGFDPSAEPLQPSEAVRGFLDALGVPPDRVPAAEQAQGALYRSLLADRRVLVLLDNARDVEQVRPLLPGSTGPFVVVTSRNRLVGLVAREGARPVPLDMLNKADARTLLALRLGEARVSAEQEAVAEVLAHCAGLPLALAVVAARAATDPGLPIRALADELKDEHSRLDALDPGDPATSVRAVFSWSYQRLSPSAARMFRLMGVPAGPDLSLAAAVSLAGLARGRVAAALDELVRAHLVAEATPGRYALHDLLRDYARYELGVSEPAPDRAEAKARLLDHYLHTAHTCAVIVYSTRHEVTLGLPRTGCSPERIDGLPGALAWYEAEDAVLMSLVARLESEDHDAHTWQLVWAMTPHLQNKARWHDWIAVNHIGLAAATRAGDLKGQAVSHRAIGRAAITLESYDEADMRLRSSLELEIALGDRSAEANMLCGIGFLAYSQGRMDESLEQCLKAVRIYQDVGDAVGEGKTLSILCGTFVRLGRLDEAEQHVRKAHSLFVAAGFVAGQAMSLMNLAEVFQHQSRFQDGIDCLWQSLELYRVVGDRFNEGLLLVDLGDFYSYLPDFDKAKELWQQALVVLEEMGQPVAETVRAKLNDLAASV